jgi:hypothetical protein
MEEQLAGAQEGLAVFSQSAFRRFVAASRR